MGEIKSAFERAMERAEKLGKESAKEREQRKREAITAQAEGLARRFLNIPSYESRELEKDLGKLEDDVRNPVASAILNIFISEVSPWSDNERLFQGVMAIRGNEQKVEELRRLSSQFREILGQKYSRLEEELGRHKKEELSKLGISGSAVCIDIDSSEDWQRTMEKLENDFAKRKKELFLENSD